MKSFSRFLLTLIVIGLVGATVCYMVNNVDYKEDIHSSEKLIKDNLIDQVKKQEIVNVKPFEEIVFPQIIDERLNEMYNSNILKTFDDNFAPDFFGENIPNYVQGGGSQFFKSSINVRDHCIEIIAYSDFLNNMVYYYENGKLICYESASVNVEGKTRYYFENDELVDIKDDYEEGITPIHEEASLILKRAYEIYDKYMN